MQLAVKICWRLFIQTLVDLTLLPCVATSTSLHSLMISPDMAMYFLSNKSEMLLKYSKSSALKLRNNWGKSSKL